MLKKISDILIRCVSKNFGWKLFSVVCSVVLWFIVMNVINPTEIQTYGVNITFLNEEKLTEKGFVIMNKEEIENTKIEIKVKSTRTALDELNKNKKEIKATVDLKQFSMIYADDVNEPFKVAVTPIIPTSYVYTYELVNFTPAEISVKLDNIVETEKEVIVDSEGEVLNGYLAGKPTADPLKVKVKGASSQIEKIDCVKVFADISDASEEIVQDLKPVACDKDGNEISSLIIEPETVQVSFGIYKYGQIPIEEPTVEGNAAEGFKVEKIEWEPKYIEVVGDADEISKVGAIKPVVKINGQSDEKITMIYDVNAHIAKNKLSIKSGTKKEITVVLTLAKEEKKELLVKSQNIAVDGNNDEYEVIFPEEIKINVKGTKDVVDSVLENDISAKVDIGGLEEGKHKLLLILELPDGVVLDGEAFVDAEIVRKKTAGDVVAENNPNVGDVENVSEQQ